MVDMPGPASPTVLRVRSARGPVPLAYVADAERLWLVAQHGAGSWAVEILRAGQGTFELPDGVRSGSCRLVTAVEDRAAVLVRFVTKYGAEQVDRWFRPPGRIVEVDFGGSGAAPSGLPYFEWLEAEFDSIAADYDRHILGNRINRLLRDRSLAFMRRTFPRTGRLMEVGCGSGTETVELLEDGHEILAVDISAKMLDAVQAKARSRGLGERLRVAKGRLGELGRFVAAEGRASFAGVYSTYGALNCEPDLTAVPAPVADLLAADGQFVAGVFNRWCGFETGVYSLLGRTGRAFGRWGRPVGVEASRFCVDAFAYSVPEFAGLFASRFRPTRVEGAPVLLPPSDLARYAEMFARRFDVLSRWDAALGRRFPFRAFGDHFLMALAPTSPPGLR